MNRRTHQPGPPGPESIDFDALLPPFAPTDVATAWLFRLQRLGIRPGLEAMNELLQRLGRPERHLPAIVVAGTNGKGSCAIALAAMCRAAGLRTGLYTSPHLLDLRERIQIDGDVISAQELFALVSAHRADIEAVRSTFFESLTALAFLHFVRRKVDVVVLEAGLGGRLDATNVAHKIGLVLTSVGLDHMELLGDTLEAIMLEKLGLAAPGVPFYVDALDTPSLDALARETVDAAGSQHVALPTLTERLTREDDLRGVFTEGVLQRAIVRKALAIYRDLAGRQGWPEPDVSRAAELVRFPGRYEVWGRSPRLILDTAHNGHALERVFAQWRKEGEHGRRILVFASVHGKDIRQALPALVHSASSVLVTAPHWYRARDPQQVAAEIAAQARLEGADCRVEVVGDVRETLEEARRRARALPLNGSAPSVLVTGSNFLVGEALDRLGVDDLGAEEHAPLWDVGLPLRRRGDASESPDEAGV